MATIKGSGDTIDSGGNLTNQTVDESAIDSSGSSFQQITGGDSSQTFADECPDDTFDEDEGDPDDFLGKEDPDNDPANDGCNQPECPTPSVCDTEPIDSPCSASVNVGVIFYGIKLFGQVIGTSTHMDQYCFNSNAAATDFFNKMVIIDNAQSKPSLGDTQINVNALSLLKTSQPPCSDLSNPRSDAALLSYRRFGPLGLFANRLPSCNQEGGDDGTLEPVDPCVSPGYLDA